MREGISGRFHRRAFVRVALRHSMREGIAVRVRAARTRRIVWVLEPVGSGSQRDERSSVRSPYAILAGRGP